MDRRALWALLALAATTLWLKMPPGREGAETAAAEEPLARRVASAVSLPTPAPLPPAPPPRRGNFNLTRATLKDALLRKALDEFMRARIPAQAEALRKSPPKHPDCPPFADNRSPDDRRISPLLRQLSPDVGADALWPSLLDLPRPRRRPLLVAVEIGSHDATQCREAASRGFFAVLCFEPSPASFDRLVEGLEAAPAGRPKNVLPLKYALTSPWSAPTVEMQAIGGTGDHLGAAPFAGEISDYRELGKGRVKVPAATLDGVWELFLRAHRDEWARFAKRARNPPEYEEPRLLVVKVDTQGHDGHVLAGAGGLLARGVPSFLLVEVWPLAMRHQGLGCAEALLGVPPGYAVHELALRGLEIDLDASGIREEWERKGAGVEEWCAWFEGRTTGVGGPDGKFGLWTDVLLERGCS